MRIRVPYHTYVTRPDGSGYYGPTPPPPDDGLGWEWTEPVPWVDDFGVWHPGFGTYERPATWKELAAK